MPRRRGRSRAGSFPQPTTDPLSRVTGSGSGFGTFSPMDTLSEAPTGTGAGGGGGITNINTAIAQAMAAGRDIVGSTQSAGAGNKHHHHHHHMN